MAAPSYPRNRTAKAEVFIMKRQRQTYILLVRFVNIPADDSITQRHALNKIFSRFISQLTSRDMVYKDPFLFLAIKHT